MADLDELPIGGSKVFAYPDAARPCILIRRDATTFAAFAQGCTHLGCPVVYQRGEDRLECPCHAGFFSATDGRVLAGPPPQPLTRIELATREGALWAVGVRSVSPRAQHITVVYAVMACLALIVGLQWVLVSAAVEAFRVGHPALLVCAMAMSGACFAASLWLIRYAGEGPGPESGG